MLQMFCYFVISRGWRYKRRGIILAFDVLLWGITFGYSMLCWRLPRHKSFCSKENSSRLLPTAGVNIAKGTRSRNQLIDFFHWIVLINYKWCTTLKQTAWIKRQVSSGESCNSTLRNFILRTFIIKSFCKKNFSGQIWITCNDAKWWWLFWVKAGKYFHIHMVECPQILFYLYFSPIPNVISVAL